MEKQDFLFELGCEELPPGVLVHLADSLHQNLINAFSSFSLCYEKSSFFATPRRLAVIFYQLDTAQTDSKVERLGPAVSAAFDDSGKPKPAATGFAQSCGVDVSILERKQTDKGERLAYVADVKGLPLSALIQEILEKATSSLPVPKAMKWGDQTFQFSRPVHWIVAMSGEAVLPVELFGLQSSNITYGHRFHANQSITITKPDLYSELLEKNYVLADFEFRKQKIQTIAQQATEKSGGKVVISQDLLNEVACLVEWPVALVGNFDEEFLSVPAEALISSMAEHQKYFHIVDEDGKLLPKFVTISNIESSNPQTVIDGNEKVIRPRLADANFFYQQDNKKPLSDYIEKLKSVMFQNKLGTIYEKTVRVANLCKVITHLLSESEEQVALVTRAAQLYKCDLMSNMVYEFPDLQGIMGQYYAINSGENDMVAKAMNEVYMPRFAGDQLPETKTGLILAIAERVDTLTGIFGVGLIPTGAKDPFALRRASLGVLRLIIENNLSLDIADLIDASLSTFEDVDLDKDTKNNLLSFIAARELAFYQSQNISTQVIASVQSLNLTKPADVNKRVFAVEAFNKTPEAADLAEANKRVKNILEKSDFDPSKTKINPDLFEKDESVLFAAISDLASVVEDFNSKSEYQSSLDKLANIKVAVNQFFDSTMINADDENIRQNRLALIYQLRQLFIGIADISLLQK